MTADAEQPAASDHATETELKLAVASAAEQEALWQCDRIGPFQVRSRFVERQTNRYYERADGRLLEHGASLRWRMVAGEPTGELTLKLPGTTIDGIVQRAEYMAKLPTDVDPLAASPTPEPLRRLYDLAGPVALRVAFEAQTERRVMELVGEGVIIEVALDRVTVPDDPHFELREVEAELKSGPRAALDALSALLRRPGFHPEPRSKHERLAEDYARRKR